MNASGWQEVALRYLASEWCDGPFGSGLASEHYRDEGARVIRLQNIRANAFDASDAAYIAEDYFQNELSRHSVIAGDLLVAGLGDDNNLVGRACLAPGDLGQALVKADCFRFRLDKSKVEPRFVMYALSSSAERDGGLLSTGSTRQRVNLGSMAGRKVLLPCRREQERVASFLDEQTTQIDALIAQKEALTAVLREEEQACIDRAVLGNLLPSSQFPFTPESADVAGETWVRCALKRHWRVTDCKHVTVEFVDEGVPLASIREVSGGVLDLTAAKRAAENDFEMLTEGGRQPRKGDLIYARNASVGAVAHVDVDDRFAMGQDVCLITSEGADQQFLRLQLLSSPVKAQLENLLVGATIRRINVEHIRDFTLLVPRLAVQQRVVRAVTGELAAREALRAHIAAHVDRLREYRSSLISAAVTGQLDVSTCKVAA